ncbi:META domain-containing protein [Methanolobus sp.]|jgi:heat shock protein HslJ|uniref:META domain-containing protein n=1 Tax=Methanolobus sp. TaxID=1874737 RepID=UPI0025CEF978|nr:META domain-containing protein [Methanolobus sp.]
MLVEYEEQKYMMSPRKILTVLLICVLAAASLFVSGCAENGTDGGDANDSEIESEIISIDDIAEVNWEWSGLFENETANQSNIIYSERYTISFAKDGVYSIKADCNSGSGSYILEGNDLTIEPGVITLMYCGSDSLDSQYLSLLASVTTVSMDNDQLVFGIGENGERMVFVKEK